MNRVLKIKNLAFLFYGICAVILCGCRKEEPEKELPVPVTEFSLLKYSMGKTYRFSRECIEKNGFALISGKEGRFLKNKNAFNKNLTVWTLSDSYGDMDVVYDGSLFVDSPDVDILKSVYRQWISEFREITDLSRMLRVEYNVSADNVRKSYDDFDAFMNDALRMDFQHDMKVLAKFVESNGYEYHFTLYWAQYSHCVEVQVSNRLALRKVPEFPMVNAIVGKSNDVLVMMVDYMTLNCMGYTTVKIADELAASDTIPFCIESKDPSDFGFVKLYYGRNVPGNLLFSGTIVWMGCGKMDYPTGFVMGKSNLFNIPSMGENGMSYIGGGSEDLDKREQLRIWQSVSKMESFQWFYSRTQKKVAVYLYTPSVGMGDPADWYYLVFVENSRR